MTITDPSEAQPNPPLTASPLSPLLPFCPAPPCSPCGHKTQNIWKLSAWPALNGEWPTENLKIQPFFQFVNRPCQELASQANNNSFWYGSGYWGKNTQIWRLSVSLRCCRTVVGIYLKWICIFFSFKQAENPAENRKTEGITEKWIDFFLCCCQAEFWCWVWKCWQRWDEGQTAASTK